MRTRSASYMGPSPSLTVAGGIAVKSMVEAPIICRKATSYRRSNNG